MRVRFTPTGRQQFLAALACIRRDNPAAAVSFDSGQRTFCAALNNFPHQAGKSRSFRNLPIEKSLSHRTDFSIVSRSKRYGLSPSGMAGSYLDTPVYDLKRISGLRSGTCTSTTL